MIEKMKIMEKLRVSEGEGESSNHDAFRSSYGISSDSFDF
jgi:hypothetical protein